MSDPPSDHGDDSRAASAATHLKEGRPAEAAAAAEAVLRADPDHAEALYLFAVASRYLGARDQALTALRRLQALQPDYGRAHQEEGHVLRALDPDAAAQAYETATRLNPALSASWTALAALRAAAGDDAGAAQAAAQAERLAGLPAELVSVTSMLHEGKLLKAERLCRAFLKRQPRHVEAMRLLAQLGLRLGVLDDAQFVLESALEFDPDYTPVLFDYVTVLSRRQRYDDALAAAERLLKRQPDNPAFQAAHAAQLMAVGRYDDALDAYDALEPRAPDPALIRLMRGHALKTIGRHGDAVAAYRGAYQARPSFGDAYWSLANLKTYRFTDAEVAAMRAAIDSAGLRTDDHIHLAYALGKACEDAGDADAAFDWYARGASAKRAELRYDPERMEASFAAQKAVCTPALFARFADAGCPDPDPIFIVGLPRAGSTLLEQILASHSQVDGTLELPHILALAHRLDGRRQQDDAPRYPGVLTELRPDQVRAFGDAYLNDTRVYRAGAPRFTDKMPNNFRHIGLIHLILPNAKIIDARRDPMACCFSGFKQLFAEGQEFSYSLDDVGRYYRGYVDLMAHWDAMLPGKILRVQYEDVIDDLEKQVRRLLEFCELPFEPACVDFHKTERAVRTASSEQVRQPLFERGVDHWRAFEHRLEPLRAALADAADVTPQPVRPSVDHC